MDRVRLIAGAALGCAALAGGAAVVAGEAAAPAAAGAPAAAKLAAELPASWQPMSDAVAAVQGSLGQVGIAGAQVAAWGDPARRCYAVFLQASVKGKPSELEAGLRAALAPAQREGDAAGAGSGSATSALEVRLPLTAPVPGMMVARLRAEGPVTHVRALACGHMDRYPEACAAQCTRLQAQLEAP